ncbi:hypothetical protein [Streptococcus cuniculi]|uniref:Glucose-6-phosphate isomerase n=1 Tax=Streptococcus cuniculi TaxID=1432788 RepID=A0A4Y9JGF4_9STRE|nr:hypothetical protein [Streptococcus cuniculi]MBF0777334.1 hypothetical protein [Streptococcus cuniculi]TFU98935.1 hypothetical protein E4T82_01105 [Streptococcus cuniculi]
MKKRVLYLGLVALFCLSACGAKEKSEVTPPVTKTSTEASSQSATGAIDFQKLAEVQPLPIQTKKEQAKLYSATNGVVKNVGLGDSEEVSYRLYQVPEVWQIDHVKQETRPTDYTYRAFEGGLSFGVQLYTLDVYMTSPLSGGEVMKKDELAQRLKADGQNFIQETSISIGDQEWKVGYEEKPENNAAKITFYRLENTGNFDDSLIVGAVIYPLSVKSSNHEEAVTTTVSQLKTILHQVAGKRETETIKP